MKRPEELVEALRKAVPQGIRSIMLYGSAAAGDYQGGRSDYNVLIILDSLAPEVLRAMAPPARSWCRAGNPPPLLFTLERLRRSADVFPIEIRDIQQQHRLLFGEELVMDIQIEPANLRRELERELKSNLVRLREGFLLVADRPKRIWQLIEESLSTFLVLIRAALRLYEEMTPPDKAVAPGLLGEHICFDHGVFAELETLRRKREKPAKQEIPASFSRYLAAIEQLADAVDRFEEGEAPVEEPGSPPEKSLDGEV